MKNNNNCSILDALLSVIIFLCLVALLFTSCRTVPPLPPTPHLHDSVRIEVRERVVHIHDSVYIQLPSESATSSTRDSMSRLETDIAESIAEICADGTLRHTLRNKDKGIKAPLDTIYKTRDSIVYRDREIPVPTPYPVEKQLTRWEKLRMEVGSIALVLAFLFGMWAIWKIFK